MKQPDPLLFSLQEMIIKFSLINRNHYLAGTKKKENDTEHSFSVALLCWFIHNRYNIDLDIGKILQYALAHDLVEVYAGDVNTFASESDRQKKMENEKVALTRVAKEFGDFSDMVEVMQKYEEKADEESIFVWTVDKMQALIMGDLDDWRPYKELSIDYDWFVEKHTQQLTNCSSYAKDIYSDLLKYCKSTYYDQPRNR